MVLFQLHNAIEHNLDQLQVPSVLSDQDRAMKIRTALPDLDHPDLAVETSSTTQQEEPRFLRQENQDPRYQPNCCEKDVDQKEETMS